MVFLYDTTPNKKQRCLKLVDAGLILSLKNFLNNHQRTKVKFSKYQHGNAAAYALLGILGVIVLVALLGMTNYVQFANYGNRTEASLEAIRDNNKNIFAQYGQKVVEAAQVPDMARDDIIKIATASMQGRYGSDGSKATWQMIREQNPSVDPKLYQKIQQLIEGGRNDFQNGQTKQLDAVRSYKTALGNVWGGFWLHLAGYPKIDLKEYTIITTDRADDTYKRGKESSPLQIRPPAGSVSK
jgi:hypothetical protein